MNILSWAAIALLAVFALKGLYKGLIITVFSTFTLIVAIAVAVNIAPYVSKACQNTVFDMIAERQKRLYLEKWMKGSER